MSVDIDWETLTGGPDGQALAENIRDFVHERFQQISFPKLIRSVKVHTFEFGAVAPEVVLKDVCEPLPDFYEGGDEDEEHSDAPHEEDPAISAPNHNAQSSTEHVRNKNDVFRPSKYGPLDQVSAPTLARGAMLGGPPNLSYFHPAFASGLSGTNTPLAAVAGAHFHSGLHPVESQHQHTTSFSSISPPSTATPPSRPISRDHSYFDSRHASAILDGHGDRTPETERPEYERSPEDLQVVFHVTYSGDVRLSMTAEVVLDYPMPSFVGIPLKLNITGIRFNGVGILAYIKKRAHLCFLSPEDAEALVGSDGAAVSPNATTTAGSSAEPSKAGGLLEEIKIESEMGENEEGKQVLKNVGKIEKFILEQVQRIFEDEFVYPSFWTFLV